MKETRVGIDEALVRRRAFELWEARGCPMGSPEEDWFMAMRSFEKTGEVAAVPNTGSTAPSAHEGLSFHADYDAASSLPLGLRIASPR